MRRSGIAPSRRKFESEDVRRVFGAYQPDVRQKLLVVRRLIFEAARCAEGVGKLTETLKWGQPSYVTAASKSGSTLRIDATKAEQADYAIYFHCRTTLVGRFRARYGDTFRYDGNRAILLRVDEPIPAVELSDCISMALTYHLDKRRRSTRKPAGQGRRGT